jgi:proteasome-associated ATPase
MTSPEEVIQQLEHKVSKYEGMLEGILSEGKKVIGTIIAGPEKRGNSQFYRVAMGGEEKLVAYAPTKFFGMDPDTLEPETEVMVIGEAITAVIPKKLETPKKDLRKMKLANWDEIGGMKSQIEIIRGMIENLTHSASIAKKIGVEPIKGLLLYGPPGCGKTLIGKAIANSILKSKEVDAAAFVYMKGAEVLSPLVGMAESAIRQKFAECRNYTRKTGNRAVMFIDEAEAILPRRGSRFSSDVDSTIVPQFLAEMDGFDETSPCVILSTNRPETMDEAVMRPGRIDLKVLVDRPTQEDVHEMFFIHSKKFKTHDELAKLARLGTDLLFTDDTRTKVSGAMVAAMMNISAHAALRRVIKDKKSPIGIMTCDLEESYNQIKVA